MEWRLFEEGTTPVVSTLEFHHERERAPHLEQSMHRGRLDLTLDFVRSAAHSFGDPSLSDLGAGDGGFLSLVSQYIRRAWGYDFTPANILGSQERGVDVREANFVDDNVELGTIVTMTEVLEHMADPHAFVRSLWTRGVKVLIASSPYVESDVSHDECHAWAWDEPGYRALLENAGWKIARHETTSGYFQVIMALR